MKLEEYITSLFVKDDPVRAEIEQSIAIHDMPMISVSPEAGQFLTMLVRMSGARKILEIGTLAGYSAICLLRGATGEGHLTSLELKPEFAQVARANLEKAGMGNQVEFYIGEALISLKKLEEQQRKFDFVFIDADKGNYSEYLNWSIHLSNQGAVIVTDNVLRHGRVLDPSDNAPSTTAIRAFNELAACHEKLDSMLVPLGDGLVIARVKS